MAPFQKHYRGLIPTTCIHSPNQSINQSINHNLTYVYLHSFYKNVKRLLKGTGLYTIKL